MLAALALVVVFAFGLSWVFTTLGLILRTPNAVMNAGFMGMAGDAAAGDIGVVLGTAAVLTAIFAPLTTMLYRRA